MDAESAFVAVLDNFQYAPLFELSEDAAFKIRLLRLPKKLTLNPKRIPFIAFFLEAT